VHKYMNNIATGCLMLTHDSSIAICIAELHLQTEFLKGIMSASSYENCVDEKRIQYS